MEAFLVESATRTCKAALIGIVENDDLDRDVSARIKVIAGKSFFDRFGRESMTDRLRRGVSEFIHPLAERERAALRIGGNFRGLGEFLLRPGIYDVPVRRRAVNHTHIVTASVQDGCKIIGHTDIEDVGPDEGLSDVIVHEGAAIPELIVVADGLIPRDRLVEPGRLEWFLVIDVVDSLAGAGTGMDHLAVQDVDIQSELVVLSVVGRIAESDAAIKRRHLVQGVDCLDSGIEDLGSIENNSRICRRITSRYLRIIATEEVYPGRAFFVGDMWVAQGEESQKARGHRRIGALFREAS